jgi:hypothetical protein
VRLAELVAHHINGPPAGSAPDRTGGPPGTPRSCTAQ